MKTLTAGVTSAMLAVGIAGSVAAYRTQAATGDVTRPAAQETSQDASPATTPRGGKPEVEWAPCAEGSILEKGACVTDVVHTVVLPAPASSVRPDPAPQAIATPQASADSQAPDESDESDDADEQDEADDHGDDHGDDDHGDDHGDDDGDDDGDDHGDDHEDDDHEDDDHEDED